MNRKDDSSPMKGAQDGEQPLDRGEQKERWLAGEGDAGFEGELLEDPDLAEQAYAALELQEAVQEAVKETAQAAPTVIAGGGPGAGSRSGRGPWGRGGLFLAGGLLAAVLAVVMILPGPEKDQHSPALNMRSGRPAVEPVGVAPEGAQNSFPLSFTWRPGRPEPGLTYRWELYDAQARRRSLEVVADTVLVLPGVPVLPDSAGTWRWFVVELLPDGRQGASSKALEFTVQAKD